MTNWLKDFLFGKEEKVVDSSKTADTSIPEFLKTASYTTQETLDETIDKDWKRLIVGLSDYVLAEQLVEKELQGKGLAEKYAAQFQETLAEVKKNRKKSEDKLFKLIPRHSQLDAKGFFDRVREQAEKEAEANERALEEFPHAGVEKLDYSHSDIKKEASAEDVPLVSERLEVAKKRLATWEEKASKAIGEDKVNADSQVDGIKKWIAELEKEKSEVIDTVGRPAIDKEAARKPKFQVDDHLVAKENDVCAYVTYINEDNKTYTIKVDGTMYPCYYAWEDAHNTFNKYKKVDKGADGDVKKDSGLSSGSNSPDAGSKVFDTYILEAQDNQGYWQVVRTSTFGPELEIRAEQLVKKFPDRKVRISVEAAEVEPKWKEIPPEGLELKAKGAAIPERINILDVDLSRGMYQVDTGKGYVKYIPFVSVERDYDIPSKPEYREPSFLHPKPISPEDSAALDEKIKADRAARKAMEEAAGKPLQDLLDKRRAAAEKGDDDEALRLSKEIDLIVEGPSKKRKPPTPLTPEKEHAKKRSEKMALEEEIARLQEKLSAPGAKESVINIKIEEAKTKLTEVDAWLKEHTASLNSVVITSEKELETLLGVEAYQMLARDDLKALVGKIAAGEVKLEQLQSMDLSQETIDRISREVEAKRSEEKPIPGVVKHPEGTEGDMGTGVAPMGGTGVFVEPFRGGPSVMKQASMEDAQQLLSDLVGVEASSYLQRLQAVASSAQNVEAFSAALDKEFPSNKDDSTFRSAAMMVFNNTKGMEPQKVEKKADLKPAVPAEKLAEKWNVSVEEINKKLAKGGPIEQKEHGIHGSAIASHHIDENLGYYDDVKEEEGKVEQLEMVESPMAKVAAPIEEGHHVNHTFFLLTFTEPLCETLEGLEHRVSQLRDAANKLNLYIDIDEEQWMEGPMGESWDSPKGIKQFIESKCLDVSLSGDPTTAKQHLIKIINAAGWDKLVGLVKETSLKIKKEASEDVTFEVGEVVLLNKKVGSLQEGSEVRFLGLQGTHIAFESVANTNIKGFTKFSNLDKVSEPKEKYQWDNEDMKSKLELGDRVKIGNISYDGCDLKGEEGVVREKVITTPTEGNYEVYYLVECDCGHSCTLPAEVLTKKSTEKPLAFREVEKEEKIEMHDGLDKESFLDIVARIDKRPDGWHVMSEKGKHLGGPYKSKEKAEERLHQVEMFKHMKKDAAVVLCKGFPEGTPCGHPQENHPIKPYGDSRLGEKDDSCNVPGCQCQGWNPPSEMTKEAVIKPNLDVVQKFLDGFKTPPTVVSDTMVQEYLQEQNYLASKKDLKEIYALLQANNIEVRITVKQPPISAEEVMAEPVTGEPTPPTPEEMKKEAKKVAWCMDCGCEITEENYQEHVGHKQQPAGLDKVAVKYRATKADPSSGQTQTIEQEHPMDMGPSYKVKNPDGTETEFIKI